ncbi:predicted protein [Nematostella vectensis]|uniref:MARVEL domain-containing protein n=1 Tax=Nematostella vectensis TaxID=45351 RepID=A7SKT4_NEMVE|nr:predicted protein [Nematostella vectensis]|eukprot:XP_001627793.1 predicted protein [Nematostella vectensis]
MTSEEVRTTVRTTATRTVVREAVRESREYRVYCGCCDPMWLVTTVEGVFKLFQFFSTFLSFVLVTSFHDSNKPQYEFQTFVGTVAWIFIIMHILLRITHIYEKLPFVLIQPKVKLVCLLVAVVSFLLSASVVLGFAFGYDLLKAAAACGYISMFLFLGEAIWVFVQTRRAASEPSQPRGEDVKPDEFVERPGNVNY